MKKELILKKVVSHLQKKSIEREKSKEIAESLKKINDINKRNEQLQNIIQEHELDKKDVQELMYDLSHTHQMLNLKKPKVAENIKVNPVEEQLKKFIKKHFHVDAEDAKHLDAVVKEMISELGDELDGMSEYDLVDIYDEKLYNLQKKSAATLSEKELKWHDELVEEIEDDKRFTELAEQVHLRNHSNLKKVHEKLLKFVKDNKIKGMTTYGEAWSKFYQAGYGPNAAFVHKLMESEGIKTSAEKPERINPKEKRKIGDALSKAGLDGNGRFKKLDQAINIINETLHDHGFELDTVTSADKFRGDSGNTKLEIARKTDDPQSPISITNSVLAFSWHLMGEKNITDTVKEKKFEVLVYFS
jgi:hypothetical protein